MKGTRLWQAPGSPLIQGRSRYVRPWWQPWLGGVACSLVLFTVGYGLYVRSWNLIALPLGLILTGSAVGALPGVWIARRMGVRQAWVAGALGGLVGSVLMVLALGG